MKKNVVDEYDEVKKTDFDEYEFDEEDFGDIEEKKAGHPSNNKKKKPNLHLFFFLGVVIVLIICGISLYRWNKGVKPDEDVIIDEAEFDTEPNDYIQPMTSEQLSGKVDDGLTTILTLGNSPFADDGNDNLLANALAGEMHATVLNAGIADSFQCRYNQIGDDSNPVDGISLYDVTYALANGDCSKVVEAASQVSDAARAKAQTLSAIDMTTVDCVVIFYDLSDYIDHRNIYNPGDDNDVTTFCGALGATISLLQEKYPYIRIVVLSTPACGKTIDDYYVDGTQIDLGNGTLNDYIGYEVQLCATRGVSFVDLYFGAIHVDNRDKLLVDDYHLNSDGAMAVARRFAKLIVL